MSALPLPHLIPRVLTAAVALALLVAAMLWLPNAWWSGLLVAPLLVAGHEWSRLAGFGNPGEWVFLALLAGACPLLWLMPGGAVLRPELPLSATDRTVFAFAVACWCVIAPCWMWLKLRVRSRVALAVCGMIVLLPAWLALARLQHDASQLLSLLAVIWIADIAAYFTGHALGRRKLAPQISPGKTWEGVGGAFAAVAVYAWLLQSALPTRYGLPFLVMVFFAMTALSIVGDLFESWIKRCAGVKDSGIAFPGHGGMLDRIDSLTAALPLAALILN